MATLINGDGNGAVYAAQDADWFAGVEGNATKRLNIGLKMAYEIEDANTIAVKDGVIVTKEGRRIQIDAGAIDEFIIPTGSQGVTRYFIIGYHLYTDASSNQLCETFVQLMASASDTIPENTFRGGSTEVYVSLYRVTQNGLTLDTIQSLLPERTTIDAVKSEIDTANKMDNIVDCSTARNVAAKTVSLSGFVLRNSAKVVVRFTNTGTTNPSSGNLTLNVNNTGAKNIIDGHTNNTTMTYSNAGNFCNNQVCEFIYNGTAWVWLNRDSNTTYTGGTLKTAAAKTGSGSTVTNTIAANTTIDNAIGTLLNNDYKINSDLTALAMKNISNDCTISFASGSGVMNVLYDTRNAIGIFFIGFANAGNGGITVQLPTNWHFPNDAVGYIIPAGQAYNANGPMAATCNITDTSHFGITYLRNETATGNVVFVANVIAP